MMSWRATDAPMPFTTGASCSRSSRSAGNWSHWSTSSQLLSCDSYRKRRCSVAKGAAAPFAPPAASSARTYRTRSMGLALRESTSRAGRSRSRHTSSHERTPAFSSSSTRSAGNTSGSARVACSSASASRSIVWSESWSSSRRGSWAQIVHACAQERPVSFSTRVRSAPSAAPTPSMAAGGGGGSATRTSEKNRSAGSSRAMPRVASQPASGLPVRSSSSIFGHAVAIAPASPPPATFASWRTTRSSSSRFVCFSLSRSERPARPASSRQPSAPTAPFS
mmetsp:Transcript_9842/g.25443  ORF Transcript_9842/g.25443 Transcript_9842/m.25443 type:complete len:279 (+) Transcript_9842:511-1347(+)